MDLAGWKDLAAGNGTPNLDVANLFLGHILRVFFKNGEVGEFASLDSAEDFLNSGVEPFSTAFSKHSPGDHVAACCPDIRLDHQAGGRPIFRMMER
jgi:hypothetical protein